MQIDFKIGQSTTFPVIRAVLAYGDDTLIPLTSGDPVVTFTMRREGYPTAKVAARATTIVNAATSSVETDLLATDTNVPGMYLGYWLVTYSNGNTVRVPNDAFVRIAVVAN